MISAVWSSPGNVLCIFLLVLLEYHLSELFLVLKIEPEELCVDSLLISRHYVLALAAGLAEFMFGWYLFPDLKKLWLSFAFPLGFLVIVAGQGIRKAAWLTARRAFTHKIKMVKRKGHSLVKHGVYAWSRHPGYLGWGLWAIGTQTMLANPISTVAFAYASWEFFRARIDYEEHCLRMLFGEEYVLYSQEVPTRIPGIR